MLRANEPLPRTVLNPRLVAIAEKDMAAEMENCPLCKKNWPPRHFRTFIKNGVLYQTPCESNSRVFDPTIPGFVGNAHCTCDYCF